MTVYPADGVYGWMVFFDMVASGTYQIWLLATGQV